MVISWFNVKLIKPTHIFLQSGAGSFAAAITAFFVLIGTEGDTDQKRYREIIWDGEFESTPNMMYNDII